MVDVIVYKPSPYGLVFIHDKTLGFIIYHTKHARVCVFYKHGTQMAPDQRSTEWLVPRKRPNGAQPAFDRMRYNIIL